MKSVITILSAGALALLLSGSAWAANEAPVTAAQIAAAKSPAEHEAIAAAYTIEAAALERKAKDHESMSRTYKAFAANPKGIIVNGQAMGVHCDRLATRYKQAAEENRQLAAMHRAMATATGK